MDAFIATFTSPGPELFQLGPFALRWYGLLIAIAVLIGLNLSSSLARKRGLEQGLISDLLPILVLTSVVGARIYYVAFEWRNYSGDNFWSSINIFGLAIPIPSAVEIWGGGIAIHGALLAGTLAVLIFCRWRRQAFWDVLDVLVPSIALGQAIGRWGNFFNNEAFGVPIKDDLAWKLFIPFVNRPLNYANNEFFHPTFLYESIWNLLVFILLIVLFQRSSKGLLKLPAGALSCLYLITYSLGRVWIEALRTDPLCLGALPPSCEGGLRIAQLMSLAMMAVGGFGLWWLYGRKRKLPDPGRPKSFA
ncbi:Prolipoprotein diacylglyceryl transferase [Prochlorococcus marinus str. MIT 1313]|uniref:prolipoprotein diacylglyceryl transferase n=1 Tax=Prochlorococcus TaxID=1218 RepID=UPI0007B3AE23|nr:prolipoprotein diacylglyceryl transferase [Prochlorococcus marinus]KZR69842.1 Prolipoprotein diacylglyceryl transferase [Prochlorococcus marinus str. MIT 1313]KZR72189.1 Prolipoprotein diacylglyceryl transferase [Prochlorococcus marinus str. MIT 1318]